MANTIKIKRGSGSDPAASDMVLGEPVLRTDTAELFFKKDDGSVAKVSGGGGGPDFKYLALRNAANNGAASYPNADFTLVTSGTTNAKIVSAANTLLVSVNGVIQKPNTGTSTPSAGFAISGSTIKFAANISAAPDFILYQESGGIGEPSDETVSEAKLQVSNSPVNGYFLSAQSGNTGGLTWAAPVATSCTGNSATATALATARAINGVNFDGTAAITVTAAAGTLSGNTLNSSVVTSSLTSLGDLTSLTVTGDVVFDSTAGSDYDMQWTTSNGQLRIKDNGKLVFGTSGDANLQHDDSNFYIKNTKGNTYLQNIGDVYIRTNTSENSLKAIQNGAVELYHNNSKRLETTSQGVDLGFVDGNIRFMAANGSANIYVNTDDSELKMWDNAKILMGASDDLQIYHSGSHSYIQDTGTGHLRITTDELKINNAADSENMITASQNGAVELYYDNSKKFETVTGGATITGVCTATSFAGDGSNLTGVSAGATGGGSDEVFYENSTTVTTSYSITSNKNAMSAGPISINNSVTVTVPSGSVWTIV
jgi:hypothetical protein|tara:strand:- start:4141 stop:5763 length:1623 start_codon:yes stop_codon:yes gene_type:complete